MTRLNRAMKSFEIAIYVTGFYSIYNTFLGPGVTDSQLFIVLATMAVGLYMIDVRTDGAFVQAHREGPSWLISRLRAKEDADG